MTDDKPQIFVAPPPSQTPAHHIANPVYVEHPSKAGKPVAMDLVALAQIVTSRDIQYENVLKQFGELAARLDKAQADVAELRGIVSDQQKAFRTLAGIDKVREGEEDESGRWHSYD